MPTSLKKQNKFLPIN